MTCPSSLSAELTRHRFPSRIHAPRFSIPFALHARASRRLSIENALQGDALIKDTASETVVEGDREAQRGD